MLFRVVRPMKQKSSRAAYFVQRIPVDVKARVVGRRLAIPFGGGVKFVTPQPTRTIDQLFITHQRSC